MKGAGRSISRKIIENKNRKNRWGRRGRQASRGLTQSNGERQRRRRIGVAEVKERRATPNRNSDVKRTKRGGEKYD